MSKARQFAPSSEKTMEGGEQLGLFDDPENTADLKQAEQFETITYSRKKPGKSDGDLSELPVETVEYTLEDFELGSPECGETLHEMTTDTRCTFEIIPAKVHVKRGRSMRI